MALVKAWSDRVSALVPRPIMALAKAIAFWLANFLGWCAFLLIYSP